MSDQSSQPSNHNAQDESAPQPAPETQQDDAQRDGPSAEWQGSAAPADSGQRFAEAVDRKLHSAESPDDTSEDGTSEDGISEDAAASAEEDESSIPRPDSS